MATINRYFASLFSISKAQRERFNINNKEDLKKMSRSIFSYDNSIKSETLVVSDKAEHVAKKEEGMARGTEETATLGTTESTSSTSQTGGGKSISLFDSIGQLPLTYLDSGYDSGGFAWIDDTSTLYMNNAQGWYKVTTVNNTPSWTSQPSSAYEIVDSNTNLVINAGAQDAEGLPLTWSYTIDDSAQYAFNVSQDSSVFTFDPLSADSCEQNVSAGLLDSATAEVTITIKASDGVNTLAAPSIITYEFTSTSFYDWPVNKQFYFYPYIGQGSGGAGVTSANCYQGGTLSQFLNGTYYNGQRASNPWLNETDNFNVSVRGMIDWRVPVTGEWNIYCQGAAAGRNSSSNLNGGQACYMAFRLNLEAGDYLRLVPGHMSMYSGFGGSGGGGGSFIFMKQQSNAFSLSQGANDIICGAGGGGGSGHGSSGQQAQGMPARSYSGNGRAMNPRLNLPAVNDATNGAGGGYSRNNGAWGGGDGAGYASNGYEDGGQLTTGNRGRGQSYANGFTGGYATSRSYGSNGGFGGGGSGSWGPGGGGGYSGGAGDYTTGNAPQANNQNAPQGGGGGGTWVRTSGGPLRDGGTWSRGSQGGSTLMNGFIQIKRIT